MVSGFGLIILLVLVMYGVFSWETGQIASAYERSSRSIENSGLAEQQALNLRGKIRLLDDLENNIRLAVGAIQGAMLNNEVRINTGWTGEDDKSLVERFVMTNGLSISREIENGKEWQAEIASFDRAIQTALGEINQLWRPRHEGLGDGLGALKRTELNWTLKVANMLFVQSSLGELLYEDISETPLEEFKSGPLYAKFAAQVPELKTAVDNCLEANERLYRGVDELDNLAFSSRWDDARLYYRDVFPASIKTIMVELDNVINLENRILYQQDQAARVLETKLKPQAELLIAQLNEAKNQLGNVLLQSNSAVIEATTNVLLNNEKLAQQIRRIDRTAIIITLAVVVIGLICAFVTTGSLTRPLRQIVAMLKGMQQGELDRRLNFKRRDELGTMGRALDRFADDLKNEILSAFNHLGQGDFTFEAKGLIREPLVKVNAALNELMGTIRESGGQVLGSSERISATSKALALGANEQTMALQKLSENLDAVIRQAHENSKGAQSTSHLAQDLSLSAGSSQEQMQNVVGAMEGINAVSRNINKIMKVIDEIAFQTNLLALNAAVEAARAGQHGKGFAVVAEEVRALANRSGQAVKEIGQLIEGSQGRINCGVDLANKAALSIEEMARKVSGISGLADEIAEASSKQVAGIQEINRAIKEIDKVTQITTATADESAWSAEDLAGRAKDLDDVLGSLRLSSDHTKLMTAELIQLPFPDAAKTTLLRP